MLGSLVIKLLSRERGIKRPKSTMTIVGVEDLIDVQGQRAVGLMGYVKLCRVV